MAIFFQLVDLCWERNELLNFIVTQANVYDMSGFFDTDAYKVIADFIFPIGSGLWLTFFTASIIRFIDLKRSCERAFDRTFFGGVDHHKLRTFEDAENTIRAHTTRLSMVAEAFSDDGHVNAARHLSSVIEEIEAAAFQAVSDVRHGVYSGLEGMSFGEGLSLRMARFWWGQADWRKIELRELPHNWLVHCQLHRIWMIKHRLMRALDTVPRRRSDCCCPKCGHRQGDI